VLENSSEDEVITTGFREHLHKSSEDGNAQIVNEECRFISRDGTWKRALVNISLVNHTDAAVLEGGLVDIRDRKAAEDQVQYMAYYDSLTGLPNRTLPKDRLATALASAGRHREKVAILFLDLDQLKIINDSLGDSFGDLPLKEVAQDAGACRPLPQVMPRGFRSNPPPGSPRISSSSRSRCGEFTAP
jgi:hypothetical protein